MPVYAAIGNSITHGAYVVSPRNTYPTHLARDKGWEVVNLAVGGSRITDAAALPFEGRKIDVVTILWGYNDYAAGQDTSVSARAYHRLIGRIRRSHPSVPIYAITQTYTSNIGPHPSSGRTAEDYRRMVRTVVDSLKRNGDGNLYLLEGLSFSDASDMADYVHFNDAGAVRFADSLAKYMEHPPVPAVPRPNPASVRPVFRTGPNPACGNITILLSLPMAISADLSIFDLRGRMVSPVSRGLLSAGNHRITWNGHDGDGLPAAAGVYVCMLRSGKRTWLAKTALIR
jgi:lysophospholipase L1-like esterase